MVPPTMPASTILERSCRRWGSMDTIAPNMMPMEPMLAKPHRAYVDITSARSVYNNGIHEFESRREVPFLEFEEKFEPNLLLLRLCVKAVGTDYFSEVSDGIV